MRNRQKRLTVNLESGNEECCVFQVQCEETGETQVGGVRTLSLIQASSSQRKLIRRVTAGKQVSPLTSNSLEFHKALYSLFL